MNIQRDLNIALMNELSMIFARLGLDTAEVLKAAGTKWNFHSYKTGMVGGHCIPVDPYYLVKKAKEVGYRAQVILAGRAINDSMPRYVATMAVKGLNKVGKTRVFSIKNGEIAIQYFILAELYKKICFIEQSPYISEILNKIYPYANGILLLFGSYAKGTENKESDIDLFVAGSCDEREIRKIGKMYDM